MADFLERFTAIDRDLLRLAIASVSAAEVERCLARPETIAHNPRPCPFFCHRRPGNFSSLWRSFLLRSPARSLAPT